MVFSMILFATATTLYMGRGAIIVSFLVAYCLTSLVAGYTSGGLYSRSNGRFWIRTMMYTASLFPLICFLVCMVLNVVGAAYGSLATVPFTSVLSVVLMWALVLVPPSLAMVPVAMEGVPVLPAAAVLRLLVLQALLRGWRKLHASAPLAPAVPLR